MVFTFRVWVVGVGIMLTGNDKATCADDDDDEDDGAGPGAGPENIWEAS